MSASDIITTSFLTKRGQQTSDCRVADLVQAGKIRIGLFPPQYTRDSTTGEPIGIWVEVCRALAQCIGVQFVVVEQSTPRELIDCLNRGDCDVGSLGFDQSRVAEVGGFSPPFIEVDYTYMLPPHSSIQSIVEADRPGIRIAIVPDHASSLALTRILRQAQQVIAETTDIAFDMLRTGAVDAWASIRPVLLDYSKRLPMTRVLEGCYGTNLPALVVSKDHTCWLAFINEFIEHAKASGLVQQAIEQSGQGGYRVAP